MFDSPPVQNIQACVSVPGIAQPIQLTGLQTHTAGRGRTFVYVAGLGGCFEWARGFWEQCIYSGICDRVVGIDLPSFG